MSQSQFKRQNSSAGASPQLRHSHHPREHQFHVLHLRDGTQVWTCNKNEPRVYRSQRSRLKDGNRDFTITTVSKVLLRTPKDKWCHTNPHWDLCRSEEENGDNTAQSTKAFTKGLSCYALAQMMLGFLWEITWISSSEQTVGCTHQCITPVENLILYPTLMLFQPTCFQKIKVLALPYAP